MCRAALREGLLHFSTKAMLCAIYFFSKFRSFCLLVEYASIRVSQVALRYTVVQHAATVILVS